MTASAAAQSHDVVEPDGQQPVPTAVSVAAAWSWRILVMLALVVVAVAAVWRIRSVTFPVIAAVLLAALLHPVVSWLRRKGLRPAPAAALVFLGFLVMVIGILTLTGRSFGKQIGTIIDKAQDGLQHLSESSLAAQWGITESDIQQWFDQARENMNQNSSAITSGAISTATTAVEVITAIVLALFTLFFFLYDGQRIWAWLVRLLPRQTESKVDVAGRLAWVTLTGYVRGTLVVAIFDAVFITVLLLILQVPLALPLGVLVFFGAFIPIVGAFISGALAVLVALVTVSPVTALVVFGGIVAIQQIESHFFQPIVLGRMVQLHPLAVVLAVATGGLIAGIGGAVIAVPLVATTNTVVLYFTGHIAAQDVRAMPAGKQVSIPENVAEVDAAETTVDQTAAADDAAAGANGTATDNGGTATRG